MAKFINLKFLVILLVIALLSGAGYWVYHTYFYINPALEQSLREEFGDEFFDDFNSLPQAENDEDQLENIVARYEPLFKNLEDTATERLEKLYQAAVEEYEEQKKSGTFDRFKLTNKYINAGRLLENSVDESFYMMLDQMRTELNRKDLPTEVVLEIEEAYIEAKDQKKQELFSRLREKIDR